MMHYALRIIITGKRTTGDVKLANIRVAGGDWETVIAKQSEVMHNIGQHDHPLGQLVAYIRQMNFAFGATTVVVRINEEGNGS